MLLLNPDHLKETQAPLLPKRQLAPGYATIVRLTVAALALVSALAIGHGVSEYVAGAWPAWAVAIPIAAFVLFATLTAVVVDDFRWHAAFGVAWGVATAVGLPWRSAGEAIMVALTIALFAASACWAYRSASSSYTTLHLFTLTRRYASTLATGVVLGLIILYGAAVNRGSALLPHGVLAGVADQAASFVPTILPTAAPAEGTSTLSVRDIAIASARAQLEADPRYRALPPEEQERVLGEAADSAAAGLMGQLGVQGSASSSVGNVAQGAFSNLMQGLQDRYGVYFVAAWLLAAFFLARSAAVVLTLIVAGVAWVLVTAAVSAGFLRIEAVPALHERITL